MVCIYLQRTVADIRTLKELLATFHSSHCQHHTSVCHGKDYKNVFITFDMSVDFLFYIFVGMY